MRASMLKAGLEQAASNKQPAAPVTRKDEVIHEAKPVRRRRRQASGKILIGGMYDPEVRRTLSLIALEPQNQGRSLQDLLGEAINDLCVKYGKPQPYRLDELDE